MRETNTGIKKGCPGVGKTEALLGRADRLSAENKEVLYLTYNLTLLNQLRSRYSSLSRSKSSTVTWLNYHEWCKRLSRQFGLIKTGRGAR